MRMERIGAAAIFALVLSPSAYAVDIHAKPLDPSALARVSAGQNNSTSTTQDINATNSGSTITAGQVTSGAVNITGSAFSGFNGVGNVVINTGNNNNIQGTMSVTITTAPPG